MIGFRLQVIQTKLFPLQKMYLFKKSGEIIVTFLLWLFFSKENYSGQFIQLKDETKLLFRDDGAGDDKVAGDGLYTAKISADVNAFRKQVIAMNQQMRKSGQRPVMFVNRQMVHDPNSFETVNEIKFDAGDLVSITGLTNAFSSDIANPDISPFKFNFPKYKLVYPKYSEHGSYK